MRLNGIYPGWGIVAYAVACQTLMVGITQASFGLYVVPVSHEFGLSRADMNSAIILMNVGGALFAPMVGWLIDRVRLRYLLLGGSTMMAIGYGVLGLSTSALMAAITIFPFLALGIAIAGRPGTALIVRWFDANRARALTLGAFGLSLGGLLVAPIVGLSIGALGWRSTLMLSGLASLVVIGLPATIMRLDPSADEMERERPRDATAGVTLPGELAPPSFKSVLSRPLFWCLAFACAMPMAISQSLLISMVPMAVENGVPPVQAALIISASGVTAFSAKIVVSLFANRVNQMWLLMSMFLVGMIENSVLFAFAENASLPVLLACGVLQGLSSGLLMPLVNTLMARIFGRASFGTVMGLMFPVIFVVSALFARMIGEVYDATGSYSPAFLGFVVIEAAAAALMFYAQTLHRRELTQAMVAAPAT